MDIIKNNEIIGTLYFASCQEENIKDFILINFLHL